MATGLIVNVGADTTEFKTEIRQLPKEFEKAEQEITQSADRVGGAIDGALKGLISAGTVVALERVINHFDKVADAASKYGETAEDIQRVGTAAELTGGNIDSIAMAMERAGVAAAKAARGNEEFVEKFNRAGIDAAAFSAATLTERVEMVAAAQNEAGSSGEQHAAILEALGDSVAGIDFQRLAEEMGNVTVASNEAVEQLSRANDVMHQAKGAAMVFAAEGLGRVADYFERIGNIIGEASGDGVLGKLAAWLKLSMQTTPAAGVAGLLGFGGKTNKELEETERRLNAIAKLRNRNIENPSEFQIEEEIAALQRAEEKAKRNKSGNADAESGRSTMSSEKEIQLRRELADISLQIREAEAYGNEERAKTLKYQEDILRGTLKYKDAEDGYAMAVREANAELLKRDEKEKERQERQNRKNRKALEKPTPEREEEDPYRPSRRQETRREPVSFNLPENANIPNWQRMLMMGRGGGRADSQSISSLFSPDLNMPNWQRMMALDKLLGQDPSQKPQDGINQDQATETTLKQVAKLIEQLSAKLPQPVLV